MLARPNRHSRPSVPTILPAIVIGLGTIVALWLVMQPGAGIAASNAPEPRAARLRYLATHAVYGIGLSVQRWHSRWSGLEARSQAAVGGPSERDQ